jgi:hypothetical protein
LVWLTYAAAGERFGVSADAIRMRAHRLGWRMQPGNDGRTLVLVPDDVELQPRPRSAAHSGARADERSPERSSAQGTPNDRLADLRAAGEDRPEQTERRAHAAEHRTEQAELRAEQAEQRGAQAEQRLIACDSASKFDPAESRLSR